MSTPKAPQRRLGRGLSALIPTHDDPSDEAPAEASALRYVPINHLEFADQPRTRFDETRLAELADSIRVNGILQPILARALPDGRYQVIAGERRSRAARLAGLPEVPVLVRESTPAQAYELALVENIQRQDLDPIEEALAYQHLVEHHQLTQDQVARRVGKDRTTVANALRLLRLPTPIQQLLVDGALTAGHARALMAAPVEDQATLAVAIQAEGLSVREAERRARALRDPQPEGPPAPALPSGSAPPAAPESAAPPLDRDDPEPSAADRAIQDQLRAALGAPVSLRHRAGRGRLEIRFSSLPELERLVELLLSLEGA